MYKLYIQCKPTAAHISDPSTSSLGNCVGIDYGSSQLCNAFTKSSFPPPISVGNGCSIVSFDCWCSVCIYIYLYIRMSIIYIYLYIYVHFVIYIYIDIVSYLYICIHVHLLLSNISFYALSSACAHHRFLAEVLCSEVPTTSIHDPGWGGCPAGNPGIWMDPQEERKYINEYTIYIHCWWF